MSEEYNEQEQPKKGSVIAEKAKDKAVEKSLQQLAAKGGVSGASATSTALLSIAPVVGVVVAVLFLVIFLVLLVLMFAAESNDKDCSSSGDAGGWDSGFFSSEYPYGVSGKYNAETMGQDKDRTGRAYPWANDKIGDSGQTIAAAGCSSSSLTIAALDAGIKKLSDGNEVNVGNLVALAGKKKAYLVNEKYRIDWKKASDLFPKGTVKLINEGASAGGKTSGDAAKKAAKDGKRVILDIKGDPQTPYGHYIYYKGGESQNVIYDPAQVKYRINGSVAVASQSWSWRNVDHMITFDMHADEEKKNSQHLGRLEKGQANTSSKTNSKNKSESLSTSNDSSGSSKTSSDSLEMKVAALSVNAKFRVNKAKMFRTVQNRITKFGMLSDSDLEKVYNIVQKAGMSPEFFFAHVICEGSGERDWLNAGDGALGNTHGGGKFGYAQADAEYFVRNSKDPNGHPAWSWFCRTHGSFNPAPKSVQEKGNAWFNSLPKGTIARAYMAGTSAATLGILYPEGLKVEGPAHLYSNPFSDTISMISSWNDNGKLDIEDVGTFDEGTWDGGDDVCGSDSLSDDGFADGTDQVSGEGVFGYENLPDKWKKNVQPAPKWSSYKPWPQGLTGQCTWYAYSRCLELGYDVGMANGNGGAWAGNMKAAGYQTSTTPKAHWIVSAPNGTEFAGAPPSSGPSYGHVGFVEHVNPDGSFLISECNFANNRSQIHYRVIRSVAGTTFINPKK